MSRIHDMIIDHLYGDNGPKQEKKKPVKKQAKERIGMALFGRPLTGKELKKFRKKKMKKRTKGVKNG